jgi:serine/threonine protein kinase
MIAFRCPCCGKNLRIQDEVAGKRVKCPTCAAAVLIPATGAPAQPAPEDLTLPPAPQPAVVAGDLSLPAAPEVSATGTRPHVPAAGRPVPEVLAEQPSGGQRYAMESEIGRGGMGAVLRAVDQQIRREVAVKFLLDGADECLKTRFVEEAQITGQLEHPNIVPIHDLGVDAEGRLYFAMKMVKGRSLAQVLDDLRQGDAAIVREYALSRLLGIFVNICHALAYAHSRCVIHRDLKPANVMLGDFGEVYVMDWGLAKVLGRVESAAEQASTGKVQTDRKADANLTQDGSVLGTPAYMPPEQAMGQTGDIDQRSDIYSLGAILYELLTLQPPVGRDGDQIAILLRVAEGKVVPPEKAAPERARQGLIPPELSAVARKALAQFPADRYQTVEALQHDIQLYLEGRSVSAKRDTAWELVKKLIKRNKGVSAATAAALVVLAVVVGFAFHFINRERQEAVIARDRAEDNYKQFLQAQEEKHASNKKSAPAFVDAARLLAEKSRFASALTQVDTALEYDPEHREAYLLRGQLLLALERYAEAVGPLEEYLRRTPDDPQARKLAELARKPEPDKAAYFLSLNEVFQQQKADAPAGHMAHLAAPLLRTLTEQLLVYRKQIDARWGAGMGQRLEMKKGELHLALNGAKKVQDLHALQGIPLSSLGLGGTRVEDLRPLDRMPLKRLDINGCPVRDLRGLERTELKSLSMEGAPVADLGPLHGLPLEFLEMRDCGNVKSLEPLHGTPLVTLSCPDSGVESFKGLEGTKNLKSLEAWGGSMGRIKDLSPLRGLPLEVLDINASNIRDFGPLRGMKLTTLAMAYAEKLDFLEGMPLKYLDLHDCARIQDLGPLKDLKGLEYLYLRGCAGVRNLSPLERLHLKSIFLPRLFPKESMEVLQRMKSLEKIEVHGRGNFEAEDFWKRYARGEFTK